MLICNGRVGNENVLACDMFGPKWANVKYAFINNENMNVRKRFYTG